MGFGFFGRGAFLGTFAISAFSWTASVALSAVSLNESFQAAVEKTEPVATAETSEAQADARLDQARGAFFPTIALNSTYQRQQIPNPATTSGVNKSFTIPDQWNARVTFAQPILHGFGEYAQYRRSSADLEAQKATVELARVTLFRTVSTTYYDVLAKEADLKNLKSLLDTMGRRVKELKERVQVGRSRESELLSAQAQSASLLAQVASAQAALDQSRQTFSATTGLDRNSDLNGELPQIALKEITDYEQELPKRPDLRAANHRTKMAEESISVSRAGHFPSLDFAANYWLRRTGPQAGIKWDIGFTLNIPVFQGGVVTAVVTQAFEAKKLAELDAARLRRDALREVRSLYSVVRNAVLQIKAFREAAVMAERNLKEQTREYRLGSVTNLEVLTALNSLYENQRQWQQIEFLAASSFLSLNAAVGVVPKVAQK